MADNHSVEERSYNMSRIRSTNTNPELLVRHFLFSNGFRYRLNVAKLPGKPDIVLKKYNVAIFINGCFWHGHNGCPHFVIPKTRTEWWLAKINRTKERDTKAFIDLVKMGWNVLIIWECELHPQHRATTLNELVKTIKSSQKLQIRQ